MYEILEALMREFNVKPYEISKKTGISSSVFTDWKKGRYTPKVDKLEKIAGFFGLPVTVFYGDISNLREALKNRKPVYQCAAGQGRVNGCYSDEYLEPESDGEFIYCTIVGDSMYPLLFDGDLVKVRPQTFVTDKDVAIVKVDGETATAKYVEVTDKGVWLRALNKEVFEDRFFSIREVLTLPISIIGKVIEVKRRLE